MDLMSKSSVTIQQARVEDITLKDDFMSGMGSSVMCAQQDDDFGDMDFMGMNNFLLSNELLVGAHDTDNPEVMRDNHMAVDSTLVHHDNNTIGDSNMIDNGKFQPHQKRILAHYHLKFAPAKTNSYSMTAKNLTILT